MLGGNLIMAGSEFVGPAPKILLKYPGTYEIYSDASHSKPYFLRGETKKGEPVFGYMGRFREFKKKTKNTNSWYPLSFYIVAEITGIKIRPAGSIYSGSIVEQSVSDSYYDKNSNKIYENDKLYIRPELPNKIVDYYNYPYDEYRHRNVALPQTYQNLKHYYSYDYQRPDRIPIVFNIGFSLPLDWVEDSPSKNDNAPLELKPFKTIYNQQTDLRASLLQKTYYYADEDGGSYKQYDKSRTYIGDSTHKVRYDHIDSKNTIYFNIGDFDLYRSPSTWEKSQTGNYRGDPKLYSITLSNIKIIRVDLI